MLKIARSTKINIFHYNQKPWRGFVKKSYAPAVMILKAKKQKRLFTVRYAFLLLPIDGRPAGFRQR